MLFTARLARAVWATELGRALSRSESCKSDRKLWPLLGHGGGRHCANAPSLRKAKFVGFQSNRCFASYLRWQLLQVREYTSVIPGAGETLGEHLAGISNLDCITVFALR